MHSYRPSRTCKRGPFWSVTGRRPPGLLRRIIRGFGRDNSLSTYRSLLCGTRAAVSSASFDQSCDSYWTTRLPGIGSSPFAQPRAPQYHRRALSPALRAAGIGYAFMGDALGGRPDYPQFYDEDGRVRYDLLSESERFRTACENRPPM